ncbi:MAG: MATE family efflux transporter [Pseudomonadota bacterium]
MSAVSPPSESSAKTKPSGEIAPLLKLAWPLIVNNLAVSAMSFADAVMAGRLSGRDLAAVAVGNSVWNLFFLGAMGVLLAVSPLVSQCFGAENYNRIGAYVREALKIAAVMGIAIVAIVWFGAEPAMRLIGIEAGFRDLAIDYTRYIVWGAPAIMCFLAIRYGLEGIGHTLPILICSLLSLVVNVAGNFVFMYGYLGAPALGGAGCGVASAIAMWFLLAAILVYVFVDRRCQMLRVFTRHKSRIKNMKQEILSLGIPISANILAEAGLFITVSLLMGRLSANAAAAHQIALNYASTMFMIPMALASAITVRVGHAVGSGRPDIARQRGYVGIVICAGFMTVSAAVLLLFKDSIVSLYTTDQAVGALAVSLLFVAAVFQISDGIQVGAAGALRGFKDTRIPLVFNLFAYWVVGFTLAYNAAVGIDPTPRNIWIGFVFGLTVAAVLLVARYVYLTRREIAAAPVSERAAN